MNIIKIEKALKDDNVLEITVKPDRIGSIAASMIGAIVAKSYITTRKHFPINRSFKLSAFFDCSLHSGEAREQIQQHIQS